MPVSLTPKNFKLLSLLLGDESVNEMLERSSSVALLEFALEDLLLALNDSLESLGSKKICFRGKNY